MSCSSCEKNKQKQNTQLVNRPRLTVNPSIPQQQVQKEAIPASPKFQIPKVLPPLK